MDVGQTATGLVRNASAVRRVLGEHFSDVGNRLRSHVAQAHVIGLAIGEDGDDADHLPELEKNLVQSAGGRRTNTRAAIKI